MKLKASLFTMNMEINIKELQKSTQNTRKNLTKLLHVGVIHLTVFPEAFLEDIIFNLINKCLIVS